MQMKRPVKIIFANSELGGGRNYQGHIFYISYDQGQVQKYFAIVYCGSPTSGVTAFGRDVWSSISH